MTLKDIMTQETQDCFRHRIKKKVIATFFLTILTLYLRFAGYKVKIVRNKLAIRTFFSQNCTFISRNTVFIIRNWKIKSEL